MDSFDVETRIFAPRQVLGWTLFTLSAGFVNAGAVMASKNFVTHITGNITNLATDMQLASDYVFIVVMFLAGAMVGVLMSETLKSKGALAFCLPLLLSFLTLIGISMAGKAGVFGPFGAARDPGQRAFVMLGLLAGAMGTINASIAVATRNQVRITHMTGPVTDLAGNLVRAALGAGAGSATELRWAALRFVKLLAFAVGAAVAARASETLRYDVFAAGAGILIVALGFTGAPEMRAEEPAEEAGDSGVYPASPQMPVAQRIGRRAQEGEGPGDRDAAE